MAAMPPRTASPSVSAAHVKALRSFNRFYTQRIGVLTPYLGSDLSLTDVRVLYELAHRRQTTATELGRELSLDAGYLSRILRRFEARQWLTRTPSPADARQSLLQLTEAGHQAFAPLQQRSRDEAAALLAPLAKPAQQQLTQALATVQRLLAPDTSPAPQNVVLRDPQPGDMGWVVQQHGEVYAREYGWDSTFEALVAEIVAGYVRQHQPDWERCWIAEVDGERVGSAFVVRKSKTVAQLRLLILTPQARGLGLGAHLTDECLAFARSKGYKKMVLWTNSCLDSARALYARRGFQLVKSEPYSGFGKDLVGETWELRL
ncbi:MAG: bifunctional helix-turn-helix transcriptional regulator/GNAT family N-acetyltransferase [Polaromonas sp.]|uniref:bifunctional helix-turn-helix transcriptional regulator/GNAT family N-acetyltransferase n=1 Tax=Polaromonas sp. TaxID=1869339 RepID=UPI00273161A6|nr:bifunctional helix-turn-helix transcriptional regulator/GNAT family N-acetyltransferase [Polaromonas sp.]MDP2448860.1 bifunctional helix-turn-helix transcriptional regulator/GNAT family N-acetyltransferase [Polaromonas sp.]MDP3245818.1 bifunctional helix-turn-helix transcriptional regulator/GNAT family N-acetyltransferase [Polaromonas sp.]MDP3755357.1 bifunctional helix-turn-helix transcriptional regulator/GNAT family N-acetyltransferase [Polaromonas sp.]MDP3828051.1 bifunctional helix-turn-